MPIQKLYRVQCGSCFGVLDELFTSHQDAVAHAIEQHWSAYPLWCNTCRSASDLKKGLRNGEVRPDGDTP